MASTADIKNGIVLNIDGQLWSVVEFQHVKPGKGGAFVRTKLKNVLTGRSSTRRSTRAPRSRPRTSTAATSSTSTTTATPSCSWMWPTTTRSTCPPRPSATPPTSCWRTSRCRSRSTTETRSTSSSRPPSCWRSPTPSPVFRATVPRPGRSPRPSRRLRDPGAAVPRDGNQGQGRHPHGRLPRPRELSA